MRSAGVRRGRRERPQPLQEGSRRRAATGAALQARGDELGQLGGQPDEIRRLGGQPDQDVHDRVALIGRVPGRREQQRRAQREHVAGHRRLPRVAGLLRGHVGGRADGAASHGELDPLGGPGHPEVDHARPVRGDQDVGRFQVPVHQPGDVNGLQRLRAACRQPPDRRHRLRAAGPDQLAQRRGRDIRGGEPGHISVGIGGHDRGREHAAHPAGRRHFVREMVPEAGFLGQFDLDGLDRNQPASCRSSQVDLTHRTRAETAEYGVRSDPLWIPFSQLL
jgi:hypothetical protein